MGYYIGDVYVLFYIIENYNGVLMDQVGIYVFWESCLLELFVDKFYDYFVGKVEYICDKNDYYWMVVLDSYVLLDSVFLIEKCLSQIILFDQ